MKALTLIGLQLVGLAVLVAAQSARESAPQEARSWLPGDHHIHSRFSVAWDESTLPPTPILGGDSQHPIPLNAEKAREYGLAWMVSTDHGGPNHSKVALEQAYPELLAARRHVPEVIQFYGMELDTPGGEHSSLLIPHTHDEQHHLHDLESRFSRRDAFPLDPARDAHERMLEALRAMSQRDTAPIVIVNHPARSATGLGVYGLNTPGELRNWNDAAPRVAVGMEGAPGHQAPAISGDGTVNWWGVRGSYAGYPTLGGFDQMAARLGGFWDSMLGEGRRWWITSTSDSHRNWREWGSDFWPGEYSKTYVHAQRSHQDILEGLRAGRVFVTTGDLISELDVTVSAGSASGPPATIGGALSIAAGDSVRIVIRVHDPAAPNHHGDRPDVARVDLIAGEITGPVSDREGDSNPTTWVVRRFTAADWKREGEVLTMEHTLPHLTTSTYLRVRGTSTAELEPEADPAGEDPWQDLWFYANPIFLEVADPTWVR